MSSFYRHALKNNIIIKFYFLSFQLLKLIGRRIYISPKVEKDVIDTFHKLYYDSAEFGQTWNNTFWLGIKSYKCPLDLWNYQEIIFKVKPDVTKLDSEINEFKNVLLPVIKTAIKQRIKQLIEDFLTLEVFKPEMRVEIKQLIENGLITREGKIAEGVEVDELISEQYVGIFKKIDIEELARCGLVKKKDTKGKE